MALLQMTIFSQVLGRQVPVNVILPQNTARMPDVCRPPLPVLYLLHGLTDDQNSWLRWTAIERYVQGRNLAVVMPCTDRGFYTDTLYGAKYFTYISEELPEILGGWFPLSLKREDNYAAGFSMGGYGALKLALRFPGRYSHAASLSGGLMGRLLHGQRLAQKKEDPVMEEMTHVFGQEISPENDIFSMLENAAQDPQKPRLFLCCGESDNLFPLNARFKEEALRLGYDCVWSGAPGVSHVFEYWDQMIVRVLDWLPGQTRAKS